MGADLYLQSIKETSREDVLNKWKTICSEKFYYGDIYDGFSSLTFDEPIFIEQTMNSKKEAEDYISKIAKKWKGPLVVHYYDNGILLTLIGGWAAS